jgi:hypothetical protein
MNRIKDTNRLEFYAPINRWIELPLWVQCLVAWSVCIPFVFWFYKLKDAFNIINFVIVVPFFFVASASILRALNEGFKEITKHYKLDSDNNTYLVGGRLITQRIELPVIVFFAAFLSFLAQLQYLLNELGYLNQQPLFLKWQTVYSPQISITQVKLFLISYLNIQYFMLFYCIIGLIAFIEFIVLAKFLFYDKRNSFRYQLPKRYLGLSKFRIALTGSSILLLMIGINAITYTYNVRPVAPANLLGFFTLFLIFIVGLTVIYFGATYTLRNRKKELINKAVKNNQENRLFKIEQNVSDSIFGIGRYLFNAFFLLLSMLGIVLSLLPETNKTQIIAWLKQYIWTFF